MTLAEARTIFTSTPGLACDRIIVTPVVDPQLSWHQMKVAVGSSRLAAAGAFAAAHTLAAWQRLLPLPEVLVQNIAVCATKTLERGR
jgi:hypothetical protein